MQLGNSHFDNRYLCCVPVLNFSPGNHDFPVVKTIPVIVAANWELLKGFEFTTDDYGLKW